MRKQIIYTLISITLFSCKQEVTLTEIKPDFITQKTINDTDDPAIWVNPENPSESIIFGTDKETNGGVYAFDLEGKIIENKTIRNINRPNNVDLAYDFKINDSVSTAILAFAERERQQIRIYSVPEMKPLDNGGIKVFTDEAKHNLRQPMGISFYHSPSSKKMYVIVGRKEGPKQGYLYQYELQSINNQIKAILVRKFGNFSAKKEIEAIAVDAENGFIYYSDEEFGVRKYYAEPSKGNQELAIIGQDKFLTDIEGIGIAKTSEKGGYIMISDQQRGLFNVFDRETNKFIKAIDLTTVETDGCDVTTANLGVKFPRGIFVAMNDSKEFYVYDFNKILKEIQK
jgi:3-phytase